MIQSIKQHPLVLHTNRPLSKPAACCSGVYRSDSETETRVCCCCCGVAYGGTLARVMASYRAKDAANICRLSVRSNLNPERVLLLNLSYHWTETRQQLTQWDSEGPNYCPYHLHNYNVFLKQGQYRNCKL